MPRQQTLQIEGRPLVDIRGPQVGTQVVASPVDTFVDQGMGQKMSRLNSLLESGQDLLAAYDANETKQGVQDRALGLPKKETVLGSYEQGWLGLDGAIKGQQDAEKVRTSFATGFDRSAPGGLEKWLQERQRELMQGMKPGPFVDAYRPKLAGVFQSLREQHATEQRDAVTAQAENNIITMFTGAIRAKDKEGQPITPEDFLTVRKHLADAGLGVDDVRMDKLGQDALKVLADEGNYQALKAAKTAFPTIHEDDLSALERHAMTVFTTKQEHADRLVKLDYEARVSSALSPLFMQAQTGDLDGAMAGFSKLVAGKMFAHSPLDIDKYQKALQSISDKSETVRQRELFIEAAEGSRLGNWGASKIINSGVHPSKIPTLLSMLGERHAEERRAMSDARADARADRQFAVIRQPDFSASVKDVLSVVPELDKTQKTLDFTGKKAQALRELRADAQRELITFAGQHGSDMGAYQESASKVRESVRKRAAAITEATTDAAILPGHIRYPNKRAFLKAYEAGEFPKNAQQVQDHIDFYTASERTGSNRKTK